MTFTQPLIRVFFGLKYSTGLQFTLDDPVKGVLDNPNYLLADADGDGVDIATDAYEISVRRGRSRELDEFEAGSASVTLRNFNRVYDNLYTGSLGVIVDENGDGFIDGEDLGGVIDPEAPYFGALVPGKRVEIEMYGQIIFAGRIEDWNLAWGVSGEAIASFVAYDALGDIGRREFDEWTTTASQAEGTRIGAALDRPEVAFGANRDLDVGQATLQEDLVSWGSNVLNYCQLAAKSGLGRLFASREGTLTYRDRNSLVGETSMVAFSDDGTGTAFHGITEQTGSESLFNRVGVDREGGILQTVDDVASQDSYGVRPLTGLSGLLMDTDAQSEDMAQYLVSIYKRPQTRVSSLSCRLHDSRLAAFRGTLAALDISGVVDVSWTPLAIGTATEQTLVVEGVTHDISNDGGHYMTLSTAPVFQTAVFVLDDALWGVLDTGPGVLAF